MGPQASGKGTIGRMLSEKLKFPLISIGDILRHLPKSHPRYKEVNELMEKGELAPQDLIAELLEYRLAQADCYKGYILDGWYRAMENVRLLDVEPDVVIVLEISEETTIRRISGRRTCTSDGEIYNIYTLPKEELEECEGELVQREDDTEEAVKKRLSIYNTETKEVVEYLKNRGTNVREVNAEGPPEEVFEAVMKVLNPII
ncbi:nucleoside monophosphate kinase [Patescibacteria group bacterium]|nr:nucleoside monophosphate kinase [Patescibacteria group bacterium]